MYFSFNSAQTAKHEAFFKKFDEMPENENIDLVSQDVAVLHRKEDKPFQYEIYSLICTEFPGVKSML
jgi:hypothetical protein